MRFCTLSFATCVLVSFQALASNYVPAERIQIIVGHSMELSDCQSLLLSAEQYRVLSESLAMHRREHNDPTHKEFTLTREYILRVEGTAQKLTLSEEENKVIEVLTGATLPVRHLMVKDADGLIENLNQGALIHLRKELDEVTPEGYRLHKRELPQNQNRDVHDLEKLTAGLELTEKQKLLVESVAASPDSFMSYEDLGFTMAWTTGTLPRKSGEFLGEINRKSLAVRGHNLMEIVRGQGVRIAVIKKTVLPAIAEIQITNVGPMSFSGMELVIANTIDFRDITLAHRKEPYLKITKRMYEEYGLSDSDLIKHFESMNRRAIQAHGKPLFQTINIELTGYRIQYSWRTESKDFYNYDGWTKFSPFLRSGPTIL